MMVINVIETRFDYIIYFSIINNETRISINNNQLDILIIKNLNIINKTKNEIMK